MTDAAKNKILIIDDDESFLKTVHDGLCQYPKLQILTRQSLSGFDVLDDVMKINPDILFMDVKLPDISGALLSDLLKSEEQIHFPIYLVSALKEDELEELLKDIPVDGVLHKGGFIERVLPILEKHFGREALEK